MNYQTWCILLSVWAVVVLFLFNLTRGPIDWWTVLCLLTWPISIPVGVVLHVWYEYAIHRAQRRALRDLSDAIARGDDSSSAGWQKVDIDE